MARHEVALRAREELADATMAFRFEKPAGFSFKAGQSVNVALIDPPPEPNSTRRAFSLASAPFEDELVVATRMREDSAFKRALKTLPLGAKVKLTGPLGAMTLHEDAARAAVFIAGGIGITPFISMLRQAAHDRLAHRLLLLYSNRRREHAAFLAELQQHPDPQRRRRRRRAQRRVFRLLASSTPFRRCIETASLPPPSNACDSDNTSQPNRKVSDHETSYCRSFARGPCRPRRRR